MKNTLKSIFMTVAVGSMSLAAVAQEAEVAPISAPVRKAKPVQVEETRPVTGRVLDAATGGPAVGVSVKAYNDSRFAAMTDEDGNYTIKLPSYVTSLIFTAEGSIPVQQSLDKGDVVPTVSIYSDKFGAFYTATTLATEKKTAGVSYNTNDVSIDNQLQSKLGGDLRTITRSGVPGQGLSMLINGINSLNANAQPLVVIDGVIQNMMYGGTLLHDGYFNNILANIMVEDIENISVLKNGTAIYGAKGANGVILIDTKRNKSMATKIDVSIGGTFEFLPKLPSIMNADEYRVYASELVGTTGLQYNNFRFLQSDPQYYYYNMYHANTDWSKEVYRQAFTQNYSINVQGGDDIANYNLSVGYAGADATLKSNSFSRFNLRLNSDLKLHRKLNVRFDASYSDVTRNLRDDAIKDNVTDGVVTNPGFLSLIKAPFLSPYAFDTNGNLSQYLSEADDYVRDITSQKGITTSLPNPSSVLQYADGDNKNYFGNRMINLSVMPKWDITKDWSLVEHFAFQIINTDENYYLPSKGVPEYYIDGLGYAKSASGALAGRNIILSSDLYAQYQHRFKAHFLNVRGGFRYYNDYFSQNIQTGYNNGNDKQPNMASALQYKQITGCDDHAISLTYYLTANYNYKERYYLSAGVSMDGSSRFGIDAADGVKIGNYAFGFFPSVQAAWVMTNEKWFKPSRGLNYLKLNAGYDLSGNDDINAQASRSYFVSRKMFAKATGISLGNIGNTRLQWETTSRFTAGLQMAAFNNRLDLSFDYFYSKTSNLLSLNSLSFLTGIENNWTNDGSLSNEGFSVSANVKVLNLKDWKWSIGASMGHYKNKIKSLPNGQEYIDNTLYGATVRTQVGGAAGLFYGYKTNGVYATAAEANADGYYVKDAANNSKYFAAGDMRFVDVDGNKCIDENDRQIIGDPNPDIYGNIATQLSYKNFTLGVTFNYSLGNDIYNYQRSILESGSFFYNQSTAMLGRWTHEGQQNASAPRASFLDPMGNSRFSDRWIEDGSYLKLKNITLSYNIPIRSTYLQGITVWAAANNLFCITRYLGSDPEFSVSNSVIGMGIDRGSLAVGRSVSLGVKINL